VHINEFVEEGGLGVGIFGRGDCSDIFTPPPQGGKDPPVERNTPRLSVIFFLLFFNVNLHFVHDYTPPPKHLFIPSNFKFLEIALGD